MSRFSFFSRSVQRSLRQIHKIRHFSDNATPRVHGETLGYINLVEQSVAFQLIDKKGASRRFYRQVFIEPCEGPHGEDGWTVFLDQRTVLSRLSRPLYIQTKDLAIAIASEWESQGDYIRLESMPLTNLQFKQNNSLFDESKSWMLRKGQIEHAIHVWDTDMLRCADNYDAKETGFYDKYWEPTIEWFNKRFDTSVKIVYAEIPSQDVDQKVLKEWNDWRATMDINDYENMNKGPNILGQEMKDMLSRYEAEKPGTFPKWVKARSDMELMVMDEMLGYCPSPILVSAVMCNGISLEHAVEAVNCLELDTLILSEHADNIKYVDTCLSLATGKTYLDLQDVVLS